MVWTEDGIAGGDLNNTPNRQFITQPLESSRTLRAGLRIRNLTSNQNIGGVCHVLSTSSAAGLPGFWVGQSPNITTPKAISNNI